MLAALIFSVRMFAALIPTDVRMFPAERFRQLLLQNASCNASV